MDEEQGSRGRSDTANSSAVRAPEQTYDGLASLENKANTSKPTAKSRTAAMSVAFEADRQAEEDARNKMKADYPVVAELVTSALIADAQTLLSLSEALSNMYDLPITSIVSSIHKPEHLMHDHSFAPSYTLRITMPPPLATVEANDRHAADLARCLQEELGILPNRGTILFLPLLESCIAIDGRTLHGVFREDIRAEKAARLALEERLAEERAEARQRQKAVRMNSFASLRSLRLRSRSRARAEQFGGEAVIVERGEGEEMAPTVTPYNSEEDGMSGETIRGETNRGDMVAKAKKSFAFVFGRREGDGSS